MQATAYFWLASRGLLKIEKEQRKECTCICVPRIALLKTKLLVMSSVKIHALRSQWESF